jgi:hypothetical protein
MTPIDDAEIERAFQHAKERAAACEACHLDGCHSPECNLTRQFLALAAEREAIGELQSAAKDVVDMAMFNQLTYEHRAIGRLREAIEARNAGSDFARGWKAGLEKMAGWAKNEAAHYSGRKLGIFMDGKIAGLSDAASHARALALTPKEG